MSDNVTLLDSRRTIDEIIKRDYNSTKFVAAMITENGSTYVFTGEDLLISEFCFLTECLRDRRCELIYGDDE